MRSFAISLRFVVAAVLVAGAVLFAGAACSADSTEGAPDGARDGADVQGNDEGHGETVPASDGSPPPSTRAPGDSTVTVLPVDEAARDPAFFAFRARLLRAIAERDTAAVLAVVDPNILLSFGGDAGVDRFREMWFEEAAERSHAGLWAELGAVLSLGGWFRDDSTFVAPYTFDPFRSATPPADFDAFSALVVIDRAVPVLAEPRPSADTLAVLSFELVQVEWRQSVADPPPGWTAVRLADGALGFVGSDHVRSVLDYRAIFNRREGAWRMSILIAGD